jgi:chromate transporter
MAYQRDLNAPMTSVAANLSSQGVSFREAFWYWLKLGFINFGGPTGQIAIMHKDLVEQKRWISEERFLHALNYCMLLPGPEAQQLAIYIGWLLHRTRGGIVAGAFFVLPSIIVLLVLSCIYVVYGQVGWVAALFYGLKPAVVAVVAEAVLRIGKKVLKNEVLMSLAALAFIAIYFLKIPFPIIVLSAGIIGYLGSRTLPAKFAVIKVNLKQSTSVISDEEPPPEHTRPSWRWSFNVIGFCILLWFTPIILLALWRGWDDILVQEGVFFSKAAMVTFGGAYAVLAYVAQQAVHHYGWIRPEQMLDGLGLAESTPGPLIMVTQFVGFLGAYSHPNGLNPLVAGTLGALITTWTTFLPSFLWIFLGAPFIEKLRGNERLSSILSAITAAVVGVILNLAVFFTQHTLFPKETGADGFGIALAVAAFIAMTRFHVSVPVVFGSAAALGFIWRIL